MSTHWITGGRLRASMATALLGWWALGSLQAEYIVALQSEGKNARTVSVGDEFDLDVVLTGGAGDQHWSSDLRIEFSTSGLRLVRYEWSFPFVSGGEDVVSVPGLAELPAMIRSDLVADGPGISNRVDVFLSNFTSAAQGYRVGRLVRLRLAVPDDHVGVEGIRVQVVPESFGAGFAVVPARAAESFRVRIEPRTGQPAAALAVNFDRGWVSLIWPAAIQGAVLQTTTDLAGEWVDLIETPEVVGEQKRVQVFAAMAAQPVFFRLRFP